MSKLLNLDAYRSTDIIKNDFDSDMNCDNNEEYYIKSDVDELISDILSEFESFEDDLESTRDTISYWLNECIESDIDTLKRLVNKYT